MGRSVSQGSSFWAKSHDLASANLFYTTADSVDGNALILSKWYSDANNTDSFYRSLLWNKTFVTQWLNYLQWKGDGHLISVAPTRAGKGVGCVIPNLLNYKGSMVVIDPKGENYAETSSYRAVHLGQQIVCLDPFSVTQNGSSDVFNPFNSILKRKEDISNANVYALNPTFDADVTRIAEALVVRTPDEKDPHWNDKAISVLRSLIIIAIYRVGLGDYTKWDLSTVREYLLMPAEQFRTELNILGTANQRDGLKGIYPPIVIRAANEILAMGDNELMSVLSTANRHMEFLDTPCVASVLGRDRDNTFSFDTLNDPNKRITIYIVIPPHYFTRYSRLIRLWISMAIDVITHRTPPIDQYPPVLFMLDEMAQLGRMEPIKQAVSLMAGYGMTLWMIIQDLAQMQGLYKEDWQTFLANAKIQQFFGINDPSTAKMISEMLGSMTFSNVIETESTQGTFYLQSQTTDGLNRNDAGRNLFTPDEIRRINTDIMLMFVQGLRPILTQKIKFFNDCLFDNRKASYFDSR